MTLTYDDIKKAVEAAGYFSSLKTRPSGKQRLIVASRRLENGRGLCGNSFWICEFEGVWYLGHWSSRLYAIPDAGRVVAFCLEWFGRVPSKLPGDFDEHCKSKYEPIDVTEDSVADRIWETEAPSDE
jgi:hypothetical protein